MFMKLFITPALGLLLLTPTFVYTSPALAQVLPEAQEPGGPPPLEFEVVPEGGEIPAPPAIDLQPAPQEPSLADGVAQARDDIIITNKAERAQTLDDLFAKLKDTEEPDAANLVAEEIWAVWLRSGSASVDYVLGRGNVAQKAGDIELAARMYDNVIRLEPEYAEGWVRSGRLALENRELSRAAAEITQGLIYEPRHFYGLWTLGNIFEQLGQKDEAFEAYSEALKLYPALTAVKDRVELLSGDVEGEAL